MSDRLKASPLEIGRFIAYGGDDFKAASFGRRFFTLVIESDTCPFLVLGLNLQFHL